MPATAGPWQTNRRPLSRLEQSRTRQFFRPRAQIFSAAGSDRRFNWAAVYAAAATLFSYFGFIHADHLAFNASPSVSLGYGLATLMFVYLAWQQAREAGHVDWSAVDNDEVRPG